MEPQKIIIFGESLDDATFTYFNKPQLKNIFKYDQQALRLLNFYKYLCRYFECELYFRNIYDGFQDPFIKKGNISDILPKENNAIVICSMFDDNCYRDLLLTECQYLLDCGCGYNNNSPSSFSHDYNTKLFPDVLKKATALLYTHPYQRVIYLYELAKSNSHSNMPNRKLIYVGNGVTGYDGTDLIHGTNVIFADNSDKTSNTSLVNKACSQYGIEFGSVLDIKHNTIGVNLYSYKSIDSLIKYPAYTLEFCSYGFKIILDESMFKLLNKFKSLIFSCNSSNIGKLIKTFNYATDTPTNYETLTEFRYRFTWSNQLEGLRNKIEDIVRGSP